MVMRAQRTAIKVQRMLGLFLPSVRHAARQWDGLCRVPLCGLMRYILKVSPTSV
jgi:hypothetical protein